MVGLGALETRQKRVMDIDRPARQLLAQVVGENLHVARQHHQLGPCFIDHLHQRGFLRSLGFPGHGQVDEANTLTFGHRSQIQVIGDDGGDGHVHFALVVAVQQVGQAVIELADHQQHTHRPARVVQLPLHGKVVGHSVEAGFQLLDVALMTIVETKHCAHEKSAAVLIVELGHFTDVAAVASQVGSHRRDNAGGRRAADLQDEMVLLVLHGVSSEGWRQFGAGRKRSDAEVFRR
ncbi:hypothetical protein ALQ37_01458 [Pseudomonas syringae pv. aptata]|uniref:Uncharacterized protein n=1 Tax=Pseudomonas syringae pv. aptata TaxID=83167 RepID=A0A3M3XBE4_PSEAP|nr:hypothetical protein ALQ37_01458 [Pseudomonas syringae pv. aptata]